MLLRANHDVPSLQRDQVVRSHQGVRRDPLAPLDHPLPWDLALQARPVRDKTTPSAQTIQYTVIQSIHCFITPLIIRSVSWSYPLSLETKISLNSRETIFSLETQTAHTVNTQQDTSSSLFLISTQNTFWQRHVVFVFLTFCYCELLLWLN